ncbi:putative lysozyme-like protein [Musca vetustissima]|nr:putative lysozyme-like protein [Musca vetustissima]
MSYSLDNNKTTTTARTNRLDGLTITGTTGITTGTTTTTNTIQIDTLNNNNLDHDLINGNSGFRQNHNNNNGDVEAPPLPQPEPAAKIPKKRSLLNFRSLDFHIKSLYSGLRNGSSGQNKANSQSTNLLAPSKGSGSGGGGSSGGDNADDLNGSGIGLVSGNVVCGGVGGGYNANGSELNLSDQYYHHHHIHQPYNRMPPYLKIESVDNEESENLLIDYPQSPYSTRRNSSNDDNRSSSQLIHLTGGGDGGHGGSTQYLQQPSSASHHRYEMSRSQASSPSPYFLSPHAFASSSQNVRRSSTSDIMSGSKRSVCSSASTSRRPSTSDLLRKARERRGSETRMGRSVSHGGLPRGGGGGGGAFRAGPGVGGRRTSMAF